MEKSTYLIFVTGLLTLLLPGGSYGVTYPCGGVTLTAVNKGTLPQAMYNSRASWDGLFNIYLFGGKDASGNKMNTIYQYSLITQGVTAMTPLTDARYSGVVLKDWLTPNVLPTFYYMGVDDDNSPTDPIYKFNPTLNTIASGGTIQTVTEGLAGAETTNHQSFLFGGPGYPWANVSSFNMQTGAVTVLGNLTLGLPSVGTAVYYPPTGNITVVASAVAGSFRDTRVLGFVPSKCSATVCPLYEGNMSSDLLGTIEDLPELDHAATASDQTENNMWIIGGYQYFEHPVEGIYQISLTNLTNEFIPVTNFPSQGKNWLSATAATWVSTGYKIFFFGGLMRDSTQSTNIVGTAVNNIWMIDLAPQYCCGKQNGLFPHPDDCTKFIQCSNQVTAIFSCPPLLVFNPLTQVCSFLTGVICTVSGILP